MIPTPLHPGFFFWRVFLEIEFSSLGLQGKYFFSSLKPPHSPSFSNVIKGTCSVSVKNTLGGGTFAALHLKTYSSVDRKTQHQPEEEE